MTDTLLLGEINTANARTQNISGTTAWMSGNMPLKSDYTSARAGYIDNINNAALQSATLSSARVGYLDNIANAVMYPKNFSSGLIFKTHYFSGLCTINDGGTWYAVNISGGNTGNLILNTIRLASFGANANTGAFIPGIYISGGNGVYSITSFATTATGRNADAEMNLLFNPEIIVGTGSKLVFGGGPGYNDISFTAVIDYYTY